MALGILKKIDLREEWKHEANDFTKWLAQQENLTLLGDEIGYDIALIGEEVEVGDFNVDILAEEEGTNKKIIIENQLEPTNHDHLGKLLTYTAGHAAGIAVWVVSNVREEHRKAIDWLNDHTDEDVEFYLVRIELWQIGDSPYAPKFEIVCKPNDWAKTVKESSSQARLTETKLDQLEFWSQLKEFVSENKLPIRLQKPSPQHWMNISVGSAEAHIGLTINSKEGLFGTELYIRDNKELYARLLDKKAEIEKELNEPLEWMELPDKKASRIKLSTSGDFEKKDNWSSYFQWLVEQAEKFQKVFPKYLRSSD